MTLFEIIITVLISLGIIIWGICVYFQKGTWLLAGWNTLSKEKKNTYNKKNICQLYGKCVAVCGIGFFLLLYGSFSYNNVILLSGIGIVALMIILTIIVPMINLILKLNLEKILKGKLYIVGGTVPYLVSNTISDREHSDIDIIVATNNMSDVREYLKKNNLYVKDLDSMMFDYNKNKIDYGIDCVIDGITINFAPFEIFDNTMVQKNFLRKQSNGINALVTVTLENVKIEDCTTTIIVDQTKIKTYNLEMVRIMKEKSNKPKDVVDIKVIDEYGYNEKKYDDLKIKTNNMKFKIFPKSKILRLFIK